MLEIFVISFGLFLTKRLMRYMRYLQQEEYHPKRFLLWIREQRAWDRRGSLICIFGWILSAWMPQAALLGGAFTFFVLFLLEPDPRKDGKLPLKYTPRAKRIFAAALGLMIADLVILYLAFVWPMLLVLVQLPPFFLALSCWALSADEKRRQQKFVSEAKQILNKVSPYVIGITGSYGKTSTKDALSNILQVTLGSTFWPAKGINTEMGITREIRERLKTGMRYAVIEMGAYGRGSIRRLCELTPPHAAIITHIGVAHLERFGSPENIYLAKSELAQAVSEEGILVCNADNEGTRRIAAEYPKRTTLLYGVREDADCRILHSEWTVEGTSFSLEWKGKVYQGKTILAGDAAMSNIAGAFTMACALGAHPDFVIAAIHHLEPVDNRLQIQKDQGRIFLHDAYNSNPSGFSSALDMLAAIPAKRRFLMTPGMIELGKQTDPLHEQIGRKAGQICDYAVIVGKLNRKTLTEGLLSGGMKKEKILYSETRDQAFTLLQNHLQERDALLIENDLTDLHEYGEKF